MLDILQGLNESQKEAVTTIEGPVLVVAGPGTGKTLALSRRITYLIQQGIKPEHIIAVTFTNRAAREMRQRTEFLLEADGGKVFIGTFHELGLRILHDVLGNNFVLYAREEQAGILRDVLKNLQNRIHQFKRLTIRPEKIIEKISRIKNFLENTDAEMHGVFSEYQAILQENNAFDLDDLILKPIEILHDPGKRRCYHDAFRYIMVDEYQDINPAQYRLLAMLAPGTGNLCCIGDADQAIYAFRGADVSNFLNFEKDFEHARKIVFKDSYRSTGTILNASNALIKQNLKRISREMRPVKENGTAVHVISVPDEKSEGEVIIQEIESRIGGSSHYRLYTHGEKKQSHHQYSLSDFAVIYRTNMQAKTVIEAFERSGIPYQIAGGRYLSRQREIHSLLCFLKYLNDPGGTLPVQRTKNLLPVRLDKPELLKFRDLFDQVSVGDFIRHVRNMTDVSKYVSEESLIFLEDIADQFGNAIARETLGDFINDVSILTPADDFNTLAEAVALMTMHMAKGLEFRIVFITGVEEGIIPYTKKKDETDIEEERRLLYVGMTRAMDELYLIHARSRFLYGQRLSQCPSLFLKEIPEKFIEHRFVSDRGRKQKNDQIGLF